MNVASAVKPAAVVYVFCSMWLAPLLFLTQSGSSAKEFVYKFAAGLIGISALTVVGAIFFFKKWYTATNLVLTLGIPAHGVAWSAKLNSFGWQSGVVLGGVSGVLLVIAIIFNFQNIAKE
ncbi:MAG: hypothetical protein ACRCSF_13210 [Mycobacteriaceae bacterium]